MSRELVQADCAAVLRKYIASLGLPIKQRGEKYFRDQAVMWIEGEPPHVRANVMGSDVYSVDLIYSADRCEWLGTCDCPMGGDCKHVYAAAREWLELLIAGRSSLGSAPVKNAGKNSSKFV